MENIIPKKKRGRKSKKELELLQLEKESSTEPETPEIKIPKKRGRKPRGGKIIEVSSENNEPKNDKMNIILHLKCSLQDIKDDQSNDNSGLLQNFQFGESKFNDLNYHFIKKSGIDSNNNSDEAMESKSDCSDSNEQYEKSDNMKNIWSKLDRLAVNLNKNTICDKKSACFWCTYDFDNPPIHIPKYEFNNSYHVYGCFCSPECGCAHLMNDKDIDNATRFERYHLLNTIYCKIYNYEKNIKPAPNPHYFLDKFYGDLNIQEYRRLLKNERLLLVVDKPLTRILPEIHEDNDEFLISNKNVLSNKYTLKKVKNPVSMNSIVNDTFNIGK